MTSRSTDSQPQPKKRIVSAPRSKATTKPVSLRFTEDELKGLDAAAVDRRLSRSDLIKQAIQRCAAENVWTIGEAPAKSRRRVREAHDHLVDLVDVLVHMGFAIDELLEAPGLEERRQEAARIMLDAQEMLKSVRKRLRC